MNQCMYKHDIIFNPEKIKKDLEWSAGNVAYDLENMQENAHFEYHRRYNPCTKRRLQT